MQAYFVKLQYGEAYAIYKKNSKIYSLPSNSPAIITIFYVFTQNYDG